MCWFIQVMNCFQKNFTPFNDQNFFEFFKRRWGGNRLLTYSSKTDHKCSMMLRSGDCGDQTRCSTSSECSSCYSLMILVVCIGALSSWKMAFPSGNITWTMGWTWLLKISKWSRQLIRLCRKIIGLVDCQQITPQIITEPPPCKKY